MKKLLTIIATAFIALSVSAQSEAGSFILMALLLLPLVLRVCIW